MLEMVDLRNLPEGHKGSLFVSFSKTQPDLIFNAKRSLTILSYAGEKQVASFQCQPTGHLLLELVFSLPNFPLSKSSKTMGTTSISLEDFFSPDSNLVVEKWLDLAPCSNIIGSKPIGLRVAISVTLPSPAPYALHMFRSQSFSKNSCLFPLPVRVQFSKSWTRIIDEGGNLVLSLQMRVMKKSKRGNQDCGRKAVVGITGSRETHTLAEWTESEWSLVNSPWSIKFPNTNNDDGHLLELTGPHTVRLFCGGRLDYEPRRCEKHKAEHKIHSLLITAVELSAKVPYGKAVALLDLKSGTVEVKEEWFLLPASVLAFILSDIAKKKGYNSPVVSNQSTVQKELPNEKAADLPAARSEVYLEAPKENAVVPIKGGACSGGCGSGCGNAVKAAEWGGCGGCGGNTVKSMESGACDGGGGNTVGSVNSGGCGGGCGGGGGGCGNMAKSGGCGGSGGCGAGCNSMKSGGCGAGCGGAGGCGNMEKSGGSGGCGGGSDGCIGALPNQAIKLGNEIVVVHN